MTVARSQVTVAAWHADGGTERLTTTESSKRFPLEVAAAWALLGAVLVAILVTYSRLPSDDLYNVSHEGIVGGLSRAFVFLNYPVALVAIPVLLLLGDLLGRRGTWVAVIVGVVLSAGVFWPGIVEESNLDAKAANAIPAFGVLIAAALTVFAAVRIGQVGWAPRLRGDVVRIAIAILAIVLALPWAGAEIGVSFDGVPVLRSLFLTGELRSQPGSTELHPAVHHGHHHGMDGALLVLSALLLSRIVPAVGRRWLRIVAGAYLALLFCYGVGNLANDFWLEQVVKRGWTDWEIPSVITPKASVAWGVIVASAVIVFALSRLEGRRAQSPATDG